MKSVYYVGLDVHKDSIQMAVFKGLAQKPAEEKSLKGDLTKLLKAVLPYKKLGEVQVAADTKCPMKPVVWDIRFITNSGNTG